LTGLLRFGLIGCGAVAKKYIAAISRIESTKISAVCDLNLDAAHRISSGAPEIEIFESTKALADSDCCDVFVVLTPSGNHASQVDILSKYKKPIIVEKPLSVSVADGLAMIDATEKHGCDLFVIKQNRQNPPVLWLKEMIMSGRLGNLVSASVRVWWSRDQAYYDASDWRGSLALDGGVFANQASHHLDTLLWMMGDATEVASMSARRVNQVETEDLANAIIRFQSGALATIEATTATRPKDIEGSIAVLGDKGSIVVGGFFMNELRYWQFSDEQDGDKDIAAKWAKTPTEFAWGHEMYIRDVIDNLRNNKPGGVRARESLKTVELIEAARISMTDGKLVRLIS
jgi:UDP-N-acetyl-2-amino-2-deoxyglucuronate dehydrogenase